MMLLSTCKRFHKLPFNKKGFYMRYYVIWNGKDGEGWELFAWLRTNVIYLDANILWIMLRKKMRFMRNEKDIFAEPFITASTFQF